MSCGLVFRDDVMTRTTWWLIFLAITRRKRVFSSINYHYFIVVNTKVGMIEKWVVSLLFSSWGKTDLPERRPLNVIIILTGWKEEEKSNPKEPRCWYFLSSSRFILRCGLEALDKYQACSRFFQSTFLDKYIQKTWTVQDIIKTSENDKSFQLLNDDRQVTKGWIPANRFLHNTPDYVWAHA